VNACSAKLGVLAGHQDSQDRLTPAVGTKFHDDLDRRLRAELPKAKRILVKVGTSVVAEKDRSPSLTRMANIVEQIVSLKNQGKEVILVSSGAIGLGSRVLLDNPVPVAGGAPVRQNVSGLNGSDSVEKRASAALGQARLMSLYDTLFTFKNTRASQILLTNQDLANPNMLTIVDTCNYLLSIGAVPVFNENDVTNMKGHVPTPTLSKPSAVTDNDALACHLAGQLGVDLVLLLTDVDGVYTAPPSTPGARIIHTMNQSSSVNTKNPDGTTSGLGRGGMEAKISAASKALDTRVPAIVIGNGFKQDTINRAVSGELIGTLIINQPLLTKTPKL
jgi:delta-1-pyrroline-5-carboxylate synthetase